VRTKRMLTTLLSFGGQQVSAATQSVESSQVQALQQAQALASVASAARAHAAQAT